MTDSLFDDAVETQEALRALYEPPGGMAALKEISALDEVARRFVACASMVFVASADAAGRCDVTPRGGPPGFVSVLSGGPDDGAVVVPDATGNRRIDTYRNVVATGRAGLIFLIPGRGQTLRVNGRACVSTRPDLLDRLTAVGKPPRAALVVRPDEVFTHCPKAFVRSGIWRPESWLPAGSQPDPAEVLHTHVGDPAITLADVERSQRESLLHRLD